MGAKREAAEAAIAEQQEIFADPARFAEIRPAAERTVRALQEYLTSNE